MSFFEYPHTRTYDSDLGWIIKNMKNSDDAIAALEEFMSNAENAFDELNKLLNDIAEGRFPEEIANAIRQYIVRNYYDMVGDMIKMLWFGLTDSGYFVAYIPDSWDAVQFNTTGYDVELEIAPDYGHLVLSSRYGG